MSGAPVRVAFVDSYAQLGGAERTLERLLRGLGSDWIAEVVALHEGPFVERLQGAGYEVEVIQTPRRLGMLAAAHALRKSLRSSGAEAVLANGTKAALVAGIATTGTSIPVVWRKSDLSRDGVVTACAALLCDRVVGMSQTAVATFGNRFKTKVRVVYNGVEAVDSDRSSARAHVVGLVGGGRETRLVVVSGRLCKQKGQLEVLESAPRILEGASETHFLFLGAPDRYEPEYTGMLRRRTGELGVEACAHFLGFRDDAQTIVAGCDLAIVPTIGVRTSRGEGFGLVAAEAMAAGTPVLAYASGALPEVIGDAGIVVPGDDRAALVEAAVRILTDAELASTLGARGRKRAEEHFLVDRMVSEFADELRSASLTAGLGRAAHRAPRQQSL